MKITLKIKLLIRQKLIRTCKEERKRNKEKRK
jgi:hypothetical protein